MPDAVERAREAINRIEQFEAMIDTLTKMKKEQELIRDSAYAEMDEAIKRKFD